MINVTLLKRFFVRVGKSYIHQVKCNWVYSTSDWTSHIIKILPKGQLRIELIQSLLGLAQVQVLWLHMWLKSFGVGFILMSTQVLLNNPPVYILPRHNSMVSRVGNQRVDHFGTKLCTGGFKLEKRTIKADFINVVEKQGHSFERQSTHSFTTHRQDNNDTHFFGMSHVVEFLFSKSVR